MESCTQVKSEELFRQLYTSHASAVYQRLYSSCMDKQLAKDILKDVFKHAYDSMQHMEMPENAAQWLNQLADEGLQKRLCAEVHTNAQRQIDQPPVQPHECVQELSAGQENAADDAQRAIASVRERGLREHTSPANREKKYTALALLLTVLLIIAIWYVTGMFMQKGILPRVDLGYTWFSTHVFQLY
jgi:DNA-directed RNA polymerase specialized sigma24 family protein